MESVIDSLPVARRRSRVLPVAVLLLLFSTLVIDGFPAGEVLLHEFGARLSNFILLAAMMVLCADALLSGVPLTLPRRDVIVLVTVLFGIPALNLPVMMMQAEVPLDGPIVDWVKQYAMLLWGLASYWIWTRLLKDFAAEELALLICVGSIIPLLCFFGDLTESGSFQSALEIFRLKRDPRISGLATEPSLYAAWLAFVWPFALYHGMHARSYAARAFGLLIFVAICATAILSHARTIAVILVLQIGYFGYLATRHGSLLQRVRTALIVFLVAAVVLAAFAQSLTSVADPEIGSNISRIGSTVTALRVAAAHPFVGVGIGQLKYFFGEYAPDFALASQEILNYATGISEYRASAFNLFARFFCEFGFGVGLLFSIVVLRPIVTAARLKDASRFVPYTVLAAIGGTGFWLSQDQYGYQPAILSLAILSTTLSSNSAPQSRR
jgi:hypothetical protein